MHYFSLNSYQIIVVLLILKINSIYSAGKIYTTANNKQYYIENEQKYPWLDALRECWERNMTLVSIDSSTKAEEVNTLILNNFGRTFLWIGGIAYKNVDSNKFIWIATGQQTNFNFWYTDFPKFNNDHDDTYCIQIGLSKNMKWANYKCTGKTGFICEDHPQNMIVNHKIHDMDTKLQKFQQEIKSQQQIKENLLIEIKKLQNLQQELNKHLDLEPQLKEQLQQIKENDLKECKENLQMEIMLKNENLLKQQLQLIEQLQQQIQTFQQAQQKQQEFQNLIENKLSEKAHEVKQSNGEGYKKFRDLIFQQNTYLQPNAQQTFHGNQ